MKITKTQLKQIIKEEITRVNESSAKDSSGKKKYELDEDRTSDSIGLERSIDNSRESLRPAVEKIMRSTYIGGYAADGAPSLWDTIESVKPGAGEKTLNSLVLSLANLQQFK